MSTPQCPCDRGGELDAQSAARTSGKRVVCQRLLTTRLRLSSAAATLAGSLRRRSSARLGRLLERSERCALAPLAPLLPLPALLAPAFAAPLAPPAGAAAVRLTRGRGRLCAAVACGSRAPSASAQALMPTAAAAAAMRWPGKGMMGVGAALDAIAAATAGTTAAGAGWEGSSRLRFCADCPAGCLPPPPPPPFSFLLAGGAAGLGTERCAEGRKVRNGAGELQGWNANRHAAECNQTGVPLP